MIIGLSGYIGSGKDTVGSMIQYITKDKNLLGENSLSYEDFIEGSTHEGYSPSGSNWCVSHTWEIKKFAGKLKRIASLLTGIPVEKFEDQEFKKSNLSSEWNSYINIAEESQQSFRTDKLTIPMTVREFLQRLGTEGIRNGVHQNAWVNALFADYKPTKYYAKRKYDNEGRLAGFQISEKGFDPILEENVQYAQGIMPNWIITDVRFPNEAQAIKDRGGYVIRIDRDYSKPIETTEGNTTTLSTHPDMLKLHLHPSETSLDNWNFDVYINNSGSLDDLLKSTETTLKTLNIIS